MNIKGLVFNTKSEKEAYDAGRDCAKNGSNTTNCHFSFFATPELMKAWELGKKDQESHGVS